MKRRASFAGEGDTTRAISSPARGMRVRTCRTIRARTLSARHSASSRRDERPWAAHRWRAGSPDAEIWLLLFFQPCFVCRYLCLGARNVCVGWSVLPFGRSRRSTGSYRGGRGGAMSEGVPVAPNSQHGGPGRKLKIFRGILNGGLWKRNEEINRFGDHHGQFPRPGRLRCAAPGARGKSVRRVGVPFRVRRLEAFSASPFGGGALPVRPVISAATGTCVLRTCRNNLTYDTHAPWVWPPPADQLGKSAAQIHSAVAYTCDDSTHISDPQPYRLPRQAFDL